MTHGGRRVGAGRPPKLLPLKRLSIGSKCESLYRNEIATRKAKAIKDDTSCVNVEHEKVNAISQSKRNEWLQLPEYQDHLDDIGFSLQTDQGLNDFEKPDLLLRIKYPRPWGVKSAIVKKVANEEKLSTRLVKTCWDEFRKMEKSPNDTT